jgi:ferritin-like metal-binding protein YciE
MTAAEEHLMAWLRDARAMEEQSETILESQITRIKYYPHLKEKLQATFITSR